MNQQYTLKSYTPMQLYCSYYSIGKPLVTGALRSMRQLLVHWTSRLTVGVLCGLLCGIPAAIADSDKMTIATDIAPIHSLVSMVVGQQADVKLLVPPSQSPHSFNLKPSQIRIINQSTMVVILSNDFTPTLSRYLNSIDNSAVVLQLSDSNRKHQVNGHTEVESTNDQKESTYSNKGHFVAHRNNDNADLKHSSTALLDDAHTWLNPENAISWIDLIEKTAIDIDEDNSAIYKNNASRARADLEAMHRSFAKQLTAVRSAKYIVYHDAYQHFAHSYGLQKPIAIALSDARAPGARKLRAMRAEAKQTQCVFSELLHDDLIVDTVTAGLSVKRAILDPMGSTIPTGSNHYRQMMQALVDNFVACLS